MLHQKSVPSVGRSLWQSWNADCCFFLCLRVWASEWGQGAWICQSISPIDGNLPFVNWKKHWRRNTQLGCPESRHTHKHTLAYTGRQRICQYCFFGGGKKNFWAVRKNSSSTGKNSKLFGENNNIVLQNTRFKTQNTNARVQPYFTTLLLASNVASHYSWKSQISSVPRWPRRQKFHFRFKIQVRNLKGSPQLRVCNPIRPPRVSAASQSRAFPHCWVQSCIHTIPKTTLKASGSTVSHWVGQFDVLRNTMSRRVFAPILEMSSAHPT